MSEANETTATETAEKRNGSISKKAGMAGVVATPKVVKHGKRDNGNFDIVVPYNDHEGNRHIATVTIEVSFNGELEFITQYNETTATATTEAVKEPDPSRQRKITYDKWFDTYKTVQNHINKNAAYDGCFFETYGKELEYVQEMVEKYPSKVWTLVEGDNGHLYVTDGFHYVNRIGYFITEVAADPKDQFSIRAD